MRRCLHKACPVRISKHRLQCRPELVSLVLFAALPLLRRNLLEKDMHRQGLKRCVPGTEPKV